MIHGGLALHMVWLSGPPKYASRYVLDAIMSQIRAVVNSLYMCSIYSCTAWGRDYAMSGTERDGSRAGWACARNLDRWNK
jgi:hypothetical protein